MRDIREITGSPAVMEVKRGDGSSEFDAGTDGTTILWVRAKNAIRSLQKLKAGLATNRFVAGFICKGDVNTKSAGVQFDMDMDVTAPGDPEIAGALWFGALMSFRKRHPVAFEKMMARLKEAGLAR